MVSAFTYSVLCSCVWVKVQDCSQSTDFPASAAWQTPWNICAGRYSVPSKSSSPPGRVKQAVSHGFSSCISPHEKIKRIAKGSTKYKANTRSQTWASAICPGGGDPPGTTEPLLLSGSPEGPQCSMAAQTSQTRRLTNRENNGTDMSMANLMKTSVAEFSVESQVRTCKAGRFF